MRSTNMRKVLAIFLLFLVREAVSSYFLDYEDEDEDYLEPVHVPKLLSTPHSFTVVAGEPVTFPCDVHDLGDFVLIWKRDRNRILFAGDLRLVRDDRFKLEGASLQITSVLPNDKSEYVCQITTNPVQEVVHTLDVLYPPSIEAKPKDVSVTAKEGETVTLMCEATGNPVPTITWKHAGRRYYSSHENDFMTVHVITNAQKSDSGKYECIADNDIGEPATATISLEIVSDPKVYIEPQSGLIAVNEGEPISIDCIATGYPIPAITWKKPNGDRIIKVSDNDGHSIHISEASKADTGSYECIAENSFGYSASAVIRVDVLFPPEVRMFDSRVYAKEGKLITISCTVEGEPSPVITWKKDDNVAILSNGHYNLNSIGNSHLLSINGVEEQDFGKYECIASNSLSSATGTTHIIGTPRVPKFTSTPYSSKRRKYTISWEVNSDTPVDEFSLSYRKKLENAEWETISVPATEEDGENMYRQMFQLVQLEPATEYEAVIKARNKFGWSEQSETFVFKTKSNEVTSPTTLAETTVAPTISEHSMSEETEAWKCFQHCMKSTVSQR